MPELRAFQMDRALLRDIIARQTGSLDRAILEAVQNSIDAGARTVAIDLDIHSVTIRDDGKGFTCREEITSNFETFGRPHEANEAKVFGAFRMGRGQLFAYGKNVWRTNTFELHVDIANHLGYELFEDRPAQPGCTVTVRFPQPRSHADVVEVSERLRDAVKWVKIPVLLNDKRISQDPATGEWFHVGDWFYFQPTLTGNLKIYNVGVLVRSYAHSYLGVGGTMVSSVPMALNFARTEPMENCPVWKAFKEEAPQIVAQLEAELKKEAAREKRRNLPKSSSSADKTPYLAVEARHQLVRQLCQGNREGITEYSFTQPFLRDSAGKWISPCRLEKLSRPLRHRIFFGDSNWNTSKLAARNKIAFVLDEKQVRVENDNAEQNLIDSLNAAFQLNLTRQTAEMIQEAIKRQVEPVPVKEATELEKSLAEVIQGHCHLLGLPYRTFQKVQVGYVGEDLARADEQGTLVLSRFLCTPGSLSLTTWLKLGLKLYQLAPQDETALQGPEEILERLPGWTVDCLDSLVSAWAEQKKDMALFQASVLDQLAHFEKVGVEHTLFRKELEGIRQRSEELLRESAARPEDELESMAD